MSSNHTAPVEVHLHHVDPALILTDGSQEEEEQPKICEQEERNVLRSICAFPSLRVLTFTLFSSPLKAMCLTLNCTLVYGRT